MTDHDEIEIKLRAEPSQLPVVRAVVGTIAMHQDFDVDAIADLKIAVDEACSMLILRAVKGSRMACRFLVGNRGIHFNAVASTEDKTEIDRTSFGWHVLETLTDSAEVSIGPAAADPGVFELCIELTRRRKSGRE